MTMVITMRWDWGGRSRAMSQLRDSLTAAVTHCQLSDGDDEVDDEVRSAA